jgi:hypothetical protein
MKTINFGVLIYQNLNYQYASSNIGDYIQSLAALNIYKKIVEQRHGTTYSIEDFLKKSLSNNLYGFNFIFIKRDNMSDLSQYKGCTNIITIMNGWWMHPHKSNGDIDFNIPKQIKPIFVSFHIANQKILAQSNINKLKAFKRIGCRDLKTTSKLKQKGINAYFTGCLTTTIDFYSWDKKNNTQYAVDTVASSSDHWFSQMGEHWKNINYKEGFASALRVLARYKKCKSVKTSRLHCFLPCLAMGVPVKFISPDGNPNIKSWNSKDRFDGLRELQNSPQKLSLIQQSLTQDCLSQIQDYLNEI